MSLPALVLGPTHPLHPAHKSQCKRKLVNNIGVLDQRVLSIGLRSLQVCDLSMQLFLEPLSSALLSPLISLPLPSPPAPQQPHCFPAKGFGGNRNGLSQPVVGSNRCYHCMCFACNWHAWARFALTHTKLALCPNTL